MKFKLTPALLGLIMLLWAVVFTAWLGTSIFLFIGLPVGVGLMLCDQKILD